MGANKEVRHLLDAIDQLKGLITQLHAQLESERSRFHETEDHVITLYGRIQELTREIDRLKSPSPIYDRIRRQTGIDPQEKK